ncbi:MAG: diguanylate cyclase [Acidobacteria bacterium]|nr:diguanylate cyclase [Acidobacteriota bacterium]
MSFDKDKFVKSAEKYLQQGKIPAAISEYHKILDLDPNDINTINTLGDLHARIGQNQEAIECYLRVANNYRKNNDTVKAIAMYKKTQKIDASNIDVCLNLAELYSHQHHNVEAKQQYNIVLDSYKRDGKTKLALKIMKAISDLDPDDINLRVEIAKSYRDESLNKEAKEMFTSLGNDLLDKDRINEAIFSFQQALTLDYSYRPAFKGLIQGYSSNNELDKAFAMLNDVLSKSPQDTEYLDLLGNIYLKAKMPEQAEATFNYLYQSDKTYYIKLLDTARVFLEKGFTDQVVTAVDRCLEYLLEIREESLATAILTDILKINSSHMQALRRLGYIYMSTQKTDNLISTLKLFVQAALSQGNKAEAFMALQQLLTIEPNQEEAKAQLVDLKESDPSIDNGIARDPLLQTFNPLTTSTDADITPPKQEAKKAPQGSTKTSALLAGMASQNPEIVESQIKLLEEMVVSYPDYIEARVKLKNSYMQLGMKEKAAEQFLILGKMYETQGNKELAREMLTEGYKLSILTGGITSAPSSNPLNRTGAFNRATGAQPIVSTQAPPNNKGLVQKAINSNSGAFQKATGNLTGGFPGSFSRNATDISNRLLTNKVLKKEWRRASRYSRLIALMVIKVDDFASYIETFGQEMAENCFKKIADTLTTELNRPGDELIVYPGEGFAVILPETPSDGATIVAERLRTSIEALSIPHVNVNQWITVNFGVAGTSPTRNSTPDELIETACAAQTQASIGGGNKVVSL